ncbi:odorant receptor 83a-like [Ceratitis capitata]|uniref:odorant receptor 83a-like n=1 Tax=Ceratitis capitata TaxID=7213 RepID=UPI000C6C430C|nr:odorant receptor 83a-like [Ceratitis capitata]
MSTDKPEPQANAEHMGSPLDVQRRDMFTFIRWSLWFTAMCRLPLEYYLPTSLRFLASTLNWIYEVFLYFTIIHIDILFMCTIYLYKDKGDLALLVNSLIQAIIFMWTLIIKVYFKRIKRKKIEELMQFLNNEYRTQSAAGFTYVTMKESVDLSNTWTKVFLISCYVGGAFWLFVPFLRRDRSLPLPCWYPFDYKSPIVYESIYLLQCLAQMQMAAAFASTSAFYLLVAVVFSGQLDVLNCSLKNVIATTYLNLRKPKSELIKLREEHNIENFEINQYYCAEEHKTDLDCLPHLLDGENPEPQNFYAAFKQAFKHCVTHHQYILCGLQMLEDIYSYLWYLKTMKATVLACLFAFVWVKSTAANSFLTIFSFSQYLVLAIWEMFMICYSAEIIFLNSQRCDEALQRSPWHLHACEIKKDILFFILNAQQPFRLTGGKMFNLNVEKFRRFLSTSFSIFTSLQQMDEREGQP